MRSPKNDLELALHICKPKIALLMLLTAIVTMLLASPTGLLSVHTLLFASLGIALAACAGGILNCIMQQHTHYTVSNLHTRVVSSPHINKAKALTYALLLGICSVAILYAYINFLVAMLTATLLLIYIAMSYLFNKKTTPQNILLGSIASAMPPLLGWTAVSGKLDASALLLVLIIFTWTPPHLWSFAMRHYQDYKKENSPVMPVAYGRKTTAFFCFLYVLLMISVTYLPFLVNMCGPIYLIGISLLNLVFLFHAIRLYKDYCNAHYAQKIFHYSVFYLAMLYLILLIDHYYPLLT